MRTRRGFTLIELLTVIAVIAVLTALLLPAIANSQDAARANACKNNLKQLGLALHNYHEVHRTFAPGWCSAKRDADEGPFFGWQTMILPFMEQAPLYSELDFEDFSQNDKKQMQTVIEHYRCPADAMVDLNPLAEKYATSSYSGSSGNERLPGAIDTPERLNGIFWRNSMTRIQSITDGTSNTFLVGERCLSSGSGVWFGVTANRNENDAITDSNHHSRLNRSMASFSSGHEGVVQFVFCDGSVHAISDKIESSPDPEEPGLFQKLAQRNDNLPVGEF